MSVETERIRDAYARRRDDRPSSRATAFVVAERRAIIRNAVRTHFGDHTTSIDICDVGCGGGGDLVNFQEELGIGQRQLAGTELLPEPLAEARRQLPDADLRLVDGFDLPWADASFDLTWSSMAFSSVRDARGRRRLFDQMLRVTRPGGLVAIYDFRVRKPSNRDVVALTGARINELGVAPSRRVLATPFLPLLPAVMRIPGAMRTAAMAALPRTHAVWMWEC